MGTKIHGPGLMAEAEKIVKPLYPTAVQVENVGIPSRGSAINAEDVDQWTFVFTDIDGSETITLGYNQGNFGNPMRDAKPWIITQIKELPRNLSLEKALEYLRSAGHKEPFQSVILRAPFPLEKGACYVFQMANKAVYMDAYSGEVIRVVEG
jgi:hypothetical protein